MTNRSKQIGTDAETAVVRWLQANGHPYVERRTLQGAKDRGDITGWPGFVLEIKAEKSIDLPGYLKELTVEMANDAAKAGAVIVRKRGTTDVGKWYWVMDVEHGHQMAIDAGY